MSIEGWSLTVQIIALAGYFSALFGIYTALNAKNTSTIQNEKQRGDFYKELYEMSEKNRPDLLAQRLKDRVDLLGNELHILHEDDAKNKRLIDGRQNQLDEARAGIKELQSYLRDANQKLSWFHCAYCGSDVKEYLNFKDKAEEYGLLGINDPIDITYYCGTSVANGRVIDTCLLINEREREQLSTTPS